MFKYYKFHAGVPIMLKYFSVSFANIIFIFIFIFLAGCGGGTSTPDKPIQNVQQKENPKKSDVVNNIPVATFSTFNISKNIRYDGQLTATDADGDILKYTIVTQPLHRTIVIHDNGCFTYTPDAGYKGSDTFSYRASDDISSCAVKTVTVNVSEPTIQTPTAPTNLIIKALSTTKLKLTWSDNSNNEEGFVIYRDGKLVATTNANETQKIICCGLEAGTTYTFEVKAKNIAGVSGSAFAQGTTKDVTTPPVAPTELRAKAVGKTSLRLKWKDNADNESAYEIYQDGIKIKTISTGCHCAVISNLIPGETYSFIVKAINKIGFANSNTISVTTLNDVAEPNQAPTATAQSITMDEDTSRAVTLAGSDPEGSTLTYTVILQPSHGTLSGTVPNLTYTPDANYYGDDSFSFTVNDGSLTSAAAVVSITVIDVAEPIYQCPATTTTEANFVDTYVNDEQEDRAWIPDLSQSVTVDQIAAEFNAARAADPTINKMLVMPSQAEWDLFSDSEKALYLINSERCARGIRVYEGIDTSVVTSPAQTYADYLKDNNVWGHQEDGRTPWQRLEEDAGVDVGTNADFFSYAENLAYIAYGSTGAYPDVHEPVAASVYGWLYDDKADTAGSYGHRKFVLATGLVENFGDNNKEGLIGMGVSTLQYNDGTYNMTKVYTVLNAFDPNSNWTNGSNVIRVDIKAAQ
jgi:hypothetical protein